MNTDLPSSKSCVDQLDPEKKIRVLIVDDHAVVRQGLRTFLELHGELSSDDPSALPIEVVGEATNGGEAVNLSQNSQPTDRRPAPAGCRTAKARWAGG